MCKSLLRAAPVPNDLAPVPALPPHHLHLYFIHRNWTAMLYQSVPSATLFEPIPIAPGAPH